MPPIERAPPPGPVHLHVLTFTPSSLLWATGKLKCLTQQYAYEALADQNETWPHHLATVQIDSIARNP